MHAIRWSKSPILLIAALAAVSACGHDPVRQRASAAATVDVRLPANVARSRSVGERAAIAAIRQVGVPYRYGGSDARGFDCSGLVHFAYASAGRGIPRTTGELWHRLPPVPADDLQVGDLLFFRVEGKVSHVGLYLGNRRFVHAPATGRDVSVTSLDSDYYRRAFVRAARP